MLRKVIATATGRNFEITDVTDLSTEFIAGFKELVDNTETLSEAFNPDIGPNFYKVDNGTPPTLYIYHEEIEGLMGTVEQASWFNDYEDVQQAYDFKTGDGTYVGWLWQSKDRDFIDLANVTHANVRSEATNIILSNMEWPGFRLEELEAWKYLNDTFFAPAELDYDFYDLSQVRVRHEKVFSYADPAFKSSNGQ